MARVVFLLVPQLHLLDLAGPAQVFSTAADLGYDYRLHYVAEQEQVPTVQGVPLRRRHPVARADPDDLVVVPGWRPAAHGPAGPVGPATCGGWPTTTRPAARWRASAPGAYALGRAGLLDGRRCTTHHDVQDELARRHPAARVVRDVLYVVDDRVVTSAGIASGIDVALHLVATRHGPAAAARIARTLVVYARRNGHEQQASAMMRHRSHLCDAVHRVQDLIDARYAEPLPLAELAAAGGVAERTLTRLFRQATGLTPLALPAAAAGGTGRAPDRARRHGRGRRPRRRLHRRPDAAPPARPLQRADSDSGPGR